MTINRTDALLKEEIALFSAKDLAELSEVVKHRHKRVGVVLLATEALDEPLDLHPEAG